MQSAGTIEGVLLDGRFQGGRMLGRGRSSVVHEAVDLIDQSPIAIRILRDECAGSALARERFCREAERLRELRHPNVVSVIHSGLYSGRPYIAMELIRGESLAARLSGGGRLGFSEFVPVAAQILQAIGHAHSRSTVIGDIEPSNIMLSEHEEHSNYVTLLDVGPASALGPPSRPAGPATLGAAGYLAPERLNGEHADTRSDVYSLGALFWRMLAGALPFDGPEADTLLNRTLHHELPSLRSELGTETNVPGQVLTLLEQCLQRAPDERPQDANFVVEALIDAVPARRFRLPRASRKTATKSAEKGDTGAIAPSRGREVQGRHEAAGSERRASPETPVQNRGHRPALLMAYGAGAVVLGAVAVLATAGLHRESGFVIPAFARLTDAAHPRSKEASSANVERVLHADPGPRTDRRTKSRPLESREETVRPEDDEGGDADVQPSESEVPPAVPSEPKRRRRPVYIAASIPVQPEQAEAPRQQEASLGTTPVLTSAPVRQSPRSRLLVDRGPSAAALSNDGLMVRN